MPNTSYVLISATNRHMYNNLIICLKFQTSGNAPKIVNNLHVWIYNVTEIANTIPCDVYK